MELFWNPHWGGERWKKLLEDGDLDKRMHIAYKLMCHSFELLQQFTAVLRISLQLFQWVHNVCQVVGKYFQCYIFGQFSGIVDFMSLRFSLYSDIYEIQLWLEDSWSVRLFDLNTSAVIRKLFICLTVDVEVMAGLGSLNLEPRAEHLNYSFIKYLQGKPMRSFYLEPNKWVMPWSKIPMVSWQSQQFSELQRDWKRFVLHQFLETKRSIH